LTHLLIVSSERTDLIWLITALTQVEVGLSSDNRAGDERSIGGEKPTSGEVAQKYFKKLRHHPSCWVHLVVLDVANRVACRIGVTGGTVAGRPSVSKR